MVLNQGDFVPQKMLVMSRDIFSCYSWGGGATRICGVEARDASQRLTMHRTTFHNKELRGSQCQQCQC